MYRKIMTGLIVAAIGLAMAMLTVCLFGEKNAMVEDSTHAVTIQGEYSIGGENARYSLENNSIPNLDGYTSVTLYGHFSEDIPQNMMVVMRIDNLRAEVYINEQQVYSFGQKGTYPMFARSAGNIWGSFRSEGITVNDTVRIELTNVYTNHVQTAYDTFLSRIYVGYGTSLKLSSLNVSATNLIMSVGIIFLGMLMLVISSIIHRWKMHSEPYFLLSFLAISAGIWSFIDFDVQSLVLPHYVFNNCLDIISLMCMQIFVALFLAYYIDCFMKQALHIMASLCSGILLVSTVTQFAGIADYYDYVGVISASIILEVIVVVVSFIFEVFKYKNKRAKRLMLSALLICIGGIADLVVCNFQLLEKAVWFRVCCLLFLIIQYVQVMNDARKFASANAQDELLSQLAYQDALTGVKNRTAYQMKCDEINASVNTDTMFGVAIFDINCLKSVNDVYGHESGDELIKNACTLIGEAFESEEIYRIGGDEFVVILPENKCQNAEEYLRHFDELVVVYNKNANAHLSLSIAYGYSARSKERDLRVTDVLSRADKRMYELKSKQKAEKGKVG